jgi:hypothetical protein
MKFVHITETHLVARGRLYGQDPKARRGAAVGDISRHHTCAELVVVTPSRPVGWWKGS